VRRRTLPKLGLRARAAAGKNSCRSARTAHGLVYSSVADLIVSARTDEAGRDDGAAWQLALIGQVELHAVGS